MVSADTDRGVGSADVIIGAASTVFSVAMLVALPAVIAAEPSAGSVASLTPLGASWWLLISGLLLQGLVIVSARRRPRAALVAAAFVAFGLSLASLGAAASILNVAVSVLVFLAVWRVSLSRLPLTLLSAGVLVAAAEMVNRMQSSASNPGEAVLLAVIQSLGVVGIPLLVGLFVRGRKDVREARRGEQQARTGERDAQIAAAVARERTAMARELHDIAAHHLSGIALMAAVVDRQIDTAPEEAHRGVQQVRAQSTRVLDDLRRLVGLLRDDEGGERSVETLGTVPELVATARAQGPIELRISTADGRDLGAGIGPLAQLAVFRTIQEALTNAATHAPGTPRSVEIDDRDDARLVVTVTNAASPSSVPASSRVPASSSGGFGLLGMLERAELVGADLQYGPRETGGWQVRASVPREADPRPAEIAQADG